MLNLDKKNCIVVENAPLGIQSAKNAGILCIAVSSTLDPIELVDADEIVPSINNLLKMEVIRDLLLD